MDIQKYAAEAKEKKDALIEAYIAENTQRSNYLKLVPRLYRVLMYDVFNGKNSYAKAVKAKCLDCAQYQKNEIKKCAVITCPLFEMRPYQDK